MNRMKKRGKIIIVTYDINGVGGIERVAQMTKEAVHQNYTTMVLNIDGSKLKKLIYTIYLNLLVMFERNTVFIWMHPRIRHFILVNVKFDLVWAYGIDVWSQRAFKRSVGIKRAKRVLTISRFTENRLHEHCPSLSISRVPLYSSLERYQNSSKNCVIKNSDREFQIITVSRLSKEDDYKNIDLVIEATNILKRRSLAICLTVIGDGDDKIRLQQIAKSFGLENNVRFLGQISDKDLKQNLSVSDLFVLPSETRELDNHSWVGEGLGIVYLEALSFGVPVLGSNVGGQTDIIRSGENGFAITPSSLEIANKIEWCMNHGAEYELIRKNAPQVIRRTYNKENFQTELLKNIDKLS